MKSSADAVDNPPAATAPRTRRGRFVRAWQGWLALFEVRERPTSLAIVRIVLGLTVMHNVYAMWRHDAWRAVWVDVTHGGLFSLDGGPLPGFQLGSPEQTALVMSVTVFGGLLTTVGLLTRFGLILAWLGTRTLSPGTTGPAADYLFFNLVGPLIVSGCGRALSLDALLWKSPTLIPAWPRYLLVGQMAMMYWCAGVQKISSGWVPGGSLDALWYILQWTHWQFRPMTWIAPFYPLTQLATLLVWTFENTAPLLILAFWYRATHEQPGRLRALFNRIDARTIYVAVGVMMQVGIWFTMEVGEFLGYCLAYFAACFTPDEWERSLRRIRRSTSAASPSSAL